MLAGRVGHGSDEPGDDLQFVLGEAVQDGVRAVAERAEEGQAGGLALVGVAQVDEVYADHIDWHQVARLVQRGCPPRLALRIVR